MPNDLGFCSKCNHEPRIYQTHAYCKECKRDYEAKRRATLRNQAPQPSSTTANPPIDGKLIVVVPTALPRRVPPVGNSALKREVFRYGVVCPVVHR